MVMGLDNIEAVEDLLRGSNAVLTRVEPAQENPLDLQTADGRFSVSPARNVDREEQSVTLYRTDTAEAVPTDLNEVVRRMSKRFPVKGDFALTYPQLAGLRTFTLGVRNSAGVLGPPEPLLKSEAMGELCWLNPKSERFDYTRRLGIRSVCRSVARWSPLRLEEHIRGKHNDAWRQHEREEAVQQREEDRVAREVSDERLAWLIEVALAQKGGGNAPAQEPREAIGTSEAPLYVSHGAKQQRRK